MSAGILHDFFQERRGNRYRYALTTGIPDAALETGEIWYGRERESKQWLPGKKRQSWEGAMAAGICIITVMVIFFGDLWIKNRIEKTDGDKFPISFAGNRFLLKKYHNTGAMLNLGASRRAAVAAVSVSFTALISIAFVLSMGRWGNHMLRVGLTLLLGGSFSNTYDRLKRKYVVDYFSFRVKWKWLQRIVFNFSDFCIIIGSFLTAFALSDK